MATIKFCSLRQVAFQSKILNCRGEFRNNVSLIDCWHTRGNVCLGGGCVAYERIYGFVEETRRSTEKMFWETCFSLWLLITICDALIHWHRGSNISNTTCISQLQGVSNNLWVESFRGQPDTHYFTWIRYKYYLLTYFSTIISPATHLDR